MTIALRWFRHRPDEYYHVKFGLCHGESPRSMPKMFDELAEYHARVAKGIVHTEEYQLKMMKLQVQFNVWRDEVCRP